MLKGPFYSITETGGGHHEEVQLCLIALCFASFTLFVHSIAERAIDVTLTDKDEEPLLGSCTGDALETP